MQHTLGQRDKVDAMEAAIQFWHRSLARFADAPDEGDLRGFLEHQMRTEVDRLISTARLPAYVSWWKVTVTSLMVALPAVDRALSRNRVIVANMRARVRMAQHLERKRDIGL